MILSNKAKILLLFSVIGSIALCFVGESSTIDFIGAGIATSSVIFLFLVSRYYSPSIPPEIKEQITGKPENEAIKNLMAVGFSEHDASKAIKVLKEHKLIE